MGNSRKGRPKITAMVMKLNDLVEYQEGSVVSREIISRKSGTVTLFAFDEGQGLSEHTAPFSALVQILEGEAEVTVAGNSLHLKTGEIVIIPANKPHSLRATKRFKMILTIIKS